MPARKSDSNSGKSLSDRTPIINSPLIIAAFICALAVFGYLFHLQSRQIQQLSQINQTAIQNQLQDRMQLSQKLTLANNQISQNLQKLSLQPQNPTVSTDNRSLNLQKLSESVCMIQGEYIFIDPKTNLPLRYQKTYSSLTSNNCDFPRPIVSNNHAYPASTKANGPILQVHYTGSGFLIDQSGHIITNGHVTKPWETSDKYRHIIETGYKPKLIQFHAFFPKQSNAFNLNIIKSSNDNDLAILKCNPGSNNLTPLPLSNKKQLPAIGDTVILLGYPTGLDLLMAQLPQSEIDLVSKSPIESYSQQALKMARQNLIAPTATRGMCGRIAQGKIIYDAGTTHGASGCPVFDVNGNVIAINTAMITAFAGTNFGIPIQAALDMLNELTP